MSSSSLAQQLLGITKTYLFCSDLFNLVAGIISNVSIILIITTLRIFRGNQCAFYLTVGAIGDMGVLLSRLPSDIATYATGINPEQASTAWCKIRFMLSYGFGLGSLFTICLLAFDQYLSTNHRYSWRQMSTLKLAQHLVFYNVCFVFLHSILFLVFAEVGPLGCSIYDPIAKLYFTFFFYPILSSILPLIISVSFSLLAYHNVRRIVRRQVPVIRRRLERQLTAIALARVFCICSLGLPFIVLSVYQFTMTYSDNNYTLLLINQVLLPISYSLLYTNFSINFYVYLIISPRFRHQAKYFLMKKIWRSLKRLGDSRSTTSNRNQVAPETIQGAMSIVESV